MLAALRRPPPAWTRFRGHRANADSILEHFGIVRPPVPIEEIIERLGIEIVESSDFDLAGAALVSLEPPVARIEVKRTAPTTRRRFTLAHELGHVLMHPAGVHHRDDSFNGGRREWEANTFAASILMPFWMLEPYVTSYSTDRLADIFKVSSHAMAIREREALGL